MADSVLNLVMVNATTTTTTTTTAATMATTTNGSEEVHHCDVDNKRETTLAEGIAIFIAVVTILFNAVILLAIVKGPSSLKKPPYWFIASLAAADLLTGAEVVTAIVVPVGTSPLSRIVLKVSGHVTSSPRRRNNISINHDRRARKEKSPLVHRNQERRALIRRAFLRAFEFLRRRCPTRFVSVPLCGNASPITRRNSAVLTLRKRRFSPAPLSGACDSELVVG